MALRLRNNTTISQVTFHLGADFWRWAVCWSRDPILANFRHQGSGRDLEAAAVVHVVGEGDARVVGLAEGLAGHRVVDQLLGHVDEVV